MNLPNKTKNRSPQMNKQKVKDLPFYMSIAKNSRGTRTILYQSPYEALGNLTLIREETPTDAPKQLRIMPNRDIKTPDGKILRPSCVIKIDFDECARRLKLWLAGDYKIQEMFADISPEARVYLMRTGFSR